MSGLMRVLFPLALVAAVITVGPAVQSVQHTGEAMAQTPKPRSRPMEKAILSRDASQVQRLIDSGADVDERMFFEETPAIMAATASTWDIVLLLIENGADPALKDGRGFSIATFARTSLVEPSTKEGQALERVRVILAERGLY